MLQGKGSLCSVVSSLGILLLLAMLTLSRPTVAHANGPAPTPNQGNCITCHEDLYFLHDTGNWFCIRESPMRCVDCHGGDPSSLKQEVAHASREAHPIINEDVSTCQECHPAECDERVDLFDQTAGISQVLVAAPYTPSYSAEENAGASVGIPQQQQEPSSLLMFWEVVPLALVTGLALTVYLIYKRHHP